MLLDDSRFKLVVCGRRWGKTATGLLAALRGHGPKPGHFKGVLDGGTVWWVAPTYNHIANSQIWHQAKKALRECTVEKNEQRREIVLTNGGLFCVRSADNEDSLRGPGLDGVVCDEAAFMKVERWEQEIRPALADKQGWAMMLTTPNGRNWIHRRFELSGQEGWKAWRHKTEENPLITAEELAGLEREIGPRKFAQEHCAEFLEIEGALWPSDYFDDIWAENWPDAFECSAIAVDPSMGATERADDSAIVFAGFSGGKVWVDSDISRRPPLEMLSDLERMHGKYNPTLLQCETVAFQAVLLDLAAMKSARDGKPPLPISPLKNTENKLVRIQRLDSLLANGLIRMRRTPSNDLLLEQLMAFPLKGYNDDGPDALEMAVRAVKAIRENAVNWGDDAEEEYIHA